jgi:hypothetical protein
MYQILYTGVEIVGLAHILFKERLVTIDVVVAPFACFPDLWPQAGLMYIASLVHRRQATLNRFPNGYKPNKPMLPSGRFRRTVSELVSTKVLTGSQDLLILVRTNFVNTHSLGTISCNIRSEPLRHEILITTPFLRIVGLKIE